MCDLTKGDDSDRGTNMASPCNWERPKNTTSDALDWGDTNTITTLSEFMRSIKPPKLCFCSITVSADVIRPLRYKQKVNID
jgi:hypothetical protein